MKYIKNQFIKSSQENSEVINFLFAPKFNYEYKGDNLDDFDNYFTDDVLDLEDVNSSLVSIVDKFLSSNTIKLEDKLAEQVSEISVSWNKEDFNLVVSCELSAGVIAEEILPELKEVIIEQVAKNIDSEEVEKQDIFAIKSDDLVEFFSDKGDAEKRAEEIESEDYEVVEGEVTVFVSFDELKSAIVNEKAITSSRKPIKSDNISVRTPTAPTAPKAPDNPVSPSGKDLNMPKIDWPKSVEIKTTADERMNDVFDRISNKPTDLELLNILETFAFSVKDTLDGTNFVLTQSPEKIKDIIIRLDDFKLSSYLNELTSSQRRNALDAIDGIEKILYSENLNQSKKTIKSSVSVASLKEKLDGRFWTRAEDFEEELNEAGWDVDDINREYATISNENGSQYEVKFVDTGDNGSLLIESFELVYQDEDDNEEIDSSRKQIKSSNLPEDFYKRVVEGKEIIDDYFAQQHQHRKLCSEDDMWSVNEAMRYMAYGERFKGKSDSETFYHIDYNEINTKLENIFKSYVEETYPNCDEIESSCQIKSTKGSLKTTGETKDEFIANIEKDLGMEVVDMDDGWMTLDDGSNVYDAEWTRYSDGDYELMHYNITNKRAKYVESSCKSIKSSRKQIKSDWEKVDMASGPIWDTPDGHWRIFEKDGKWVLRNLEYSQTKDCFYNSFEEASQKAEDIDFVIDDEVYKRLERNPDIDVESVYEKVARKVIETESFFHK